MKLISVSLNLLLDNQAQARWKEKVNRVTPVGSSLS